MEKVKKTDAKKIRTPHIFFVLFVAIIIAAISTWIVPAGQFDRVEGPGGRMMIVADSYKPIESKPAGIMDILTAIPSGLASSASVVFGVMIVGGAFGVINATKTIDIALKRFTLKFKGREIIMVPIIMILFSLLASFIGTPELCLVYIPIIMSLCETMKWDAMVAASITLVGVTAGFSTALINPFSVGIAQQIAELPAGSGMGFRAISCAALLIGGILYTMRYVRRISANPSLSLVQEKNTSLNTLYEEIPDKIEGKHMLTGLSLIIGLIILVHGIVSYGWYMNELAAIFVLITLAVGLVNKMAPNTIAEAFAKGCGNVLVGALVVGFARGVSVVIENGAIMDTIINSLSYVIKSLPSGITSIGFVIAQTLINFLIPSSSGQAVIAMPITIPLADLAGITRQTAILAFQFGDGMSNIIFPTSGYFMATLAMAGIPYQKWLKYFGALFAIWIATASVLVVVAQVIGWA